MAADNPNSNRFLPPLFQGLEAGVFLTFVGSYVSVSLIGLGTGLVLVFGLLMALAGRRFDVFRGNPLFWPLLFLIAAILISIALAEPYDFRKPLGKVRYLVCLFFIALFFHQKPGAKNSVLKLAQALAVLLGLIAILQFTGTFSPLPLFGGHEPSPLPHGDGKYFLATGFSFHHIPFASTLIMLFHIFVARFLVFGQSDPQQKWLRYALPAAACAVGIFCSFSRGAWLAWFGSTLVLLAVYQWRVVWKATLGLAALVMGLVALFPHFRMRLADIRADRNEDRLELWRICFEMFKESPLFGHGFYSFGSFYQRYTDWHLNREHFPVEAHNMYLDLLAGTGLVGTLCFAFFVLSAWRLSWVEFHEKSLSLDDKAWSLGVLGVITSFCIAGAFDKQFYMTQTLVPNIFFLGLLCSRQLALNSPLLTSVQIKPAR